MERSLGLERVQVDRGTAGVHSQVSCVQWGPSFLPCLLLGVAVIIKNEMMQLGVMAHAFNSSTQRQRQADL